MFKISIQLPEFKTIEYFSSIVPMVGDTIIVDLKFFEVVKRILPNDNPNFVIIHVK